MEASSHALDQDRAAAVSFAAAGFTNLTQDHLDYHKGFEDYYLCKRKLFQQLGVSHPDAQALSCANPAAINADDPYGRRLLAECASLGVRPVAYSIVPGAAADVRAENIRATAAGTSFTLSAFGANAAVETALIGEYNVSNILCAAAMTMAAGIPISTVAEAVSAAKPRWGRLEPFDTAAGARVFVDYAHSPDAISRALAALRRVSAGRVIAVFGCGGDRDRAKRPLMARAAADGADLVIVTSDNPRSEDPEAIIGEAVAGFAGSATPWQRIADRRAAIAAAIAEARAGDVVLLAGKGHENYQEINGVRHHFDDRETVRELIGCPTTSGGR
jgi:UDP-N-acetylmuramoyl-L-alanyl-D-glutamate--2,6-diaminopimelate ligase